MLRLRDFKGLLESTLIVLMITNLISEAATPSAYVSAWVLQSDRLICVVADSVAVGHTQLLNKRPLHTSIDITTHAVTTSATAVYAREAGRVR